MKLSIGIKRIGNDNKGTSRFTEGMKNHLSITRTLRLRSPRRRYRSVAQVLQVKSTNRPSSSQSLGVRPIVLSPRLRNIPSLLLLLLPTSPTVYRHRHRSSSPRSLLPSLPPNQNSTSSFAESLLPSLRSQLDGTTNSSSNHTFQQRIPPFSEVVEYGL
jgi:hypothetical protein